MLHAPIGRGRHAAGVLIWGRWRHTDPDINLSSDRPTDRTNSHSALYSLPNTRYTLKLWKAVRSSADSVNR